MLWQVRRRAEDARPFIVRQPWTKFLLYILAFVVTQFPCAVYTIVEWFAAWEDPNGKIDLLWACVVAQQMHGFANGLIYGLTNPLIRDHWSGVLNDISSRIVPRSMRPDVFDAHDLNELPLEFVSSNEASPRPAMAITPAPATANGVLPP